MKASEAKIGHKYLTQKGATVTMTGEKDGKIVMALPSGIVFRCGPDYELEPIDGKAHKPNAAHRTKAAAAPEHKPAVTLTVVQPHVVSLASIIDPLLMSGGHTVSDIAVEVRDKAGDAVNGKDVEANVRARMVTYTRRGWRVVKDADKRVKVIQGK
ncbi:MAG: hypothetical protein PHP45_04695 [Elusimicrobiales bacterium]|nr:hypothetical protein [Elusimicrobiales bacterium]